MPDTREVLTTKAADAKLRTLALGEPNAGPMRWLQLKDGTKVLQQGWRFIGRDIIWADVPMDIEQ